MAEHREVASGKAQTVAALAAAGCVFAEEEATLLSEQAADSDELADLVARRVAGEPLEHILGWVEFDGSQLRVGPGVFVPRQRSVFLARIAVDAARRCRGGVLLEVCCGVAPIATVVARDAAGIEILASDNHEPSLRYARENLSGAQVYKSDLFGDLPVSLRRRVDLVVAVPPYVPTGAADQLPLEARLFDRPEALFGGPDGLDVVRAILEEAPAWLHPEGAVLLEMHRSQTPMATDEGQRRGYVTTPAYQSDEQTAVVQFAAASD